jgi:hypothetical protein
VFINMFCVECIELCQSIMCQSWVNCRAMLVDVSMNMMTRGRTNSRMLCVLVLRCLGSSFEFVFGTGSLFLPFLRWQNQRDKAAFV